MNVSRIHPLLRTTLTLTEHHQNWFCEAELMQVECI